MKKGVIGGCYSKGDRDLQCKETITNKEVPEDSKAEIPKVHPKWTTIDWQNYKQDGYVIMRKNYLVSKAMD